MQGIFWHFSSAQLHQSGFKATFELLSGKDFGEVSEIEKHKTWFEAFRGNYVFTEENTEEMELCPICGENYMIYGEKMCETCKKKSEYEEEETEESVLMNSVSV